MSNEDSNNKPKVEVFKRVNHLKAKIGANPFNEDEEGIISEEAIAKADKLVCETCEDCPTLIEAALGKLDNFWKQARDLDHGSERSELCEDIFLCSHDIKDLAAMCGYPLMADFSESLRDYIKATELNLDAHRIIIQSLVDAMNVTYRQGLRDTDEGTAQELKAAVEKAIKRYQ